MRTWQVGYFVGSLAKGSINRKLAGALVRLAPPELKFTEIPIRDLPLYNYDYDPDYPEVARRFKDAIEKSDAILFVTPEYNRGVPGGLKNAIDWASRPYGKNAFTRKLCAVIGCSPGKIGTAIAQRELHSMLGYCDAIQMTAPEPYIQFTKDLIDDKGNVSDESTRKFLEKFIAAFRSFVTGAGPESHKTAA
jgi:chromate reductase, NAD(P)H dehydrogenase (quinone)